VNGTFYRTVKLWRMSMAQFRRLDVLQAMVQSGLVPIFYHQDVEVAKQIAEAVTRGGAKVLEFTNRGDFAFTVFSELVQWVREKIPDLILGAGSILDPGTAALYMNHGANFIVGPVLNVEVAKVCNRRKIAYVPGCGSATEISQAEEWGVEICKVFPGAEVGGPGFVKNILAPMPLSLIMPTGGVERTRASIEKWFKAGVACVGMGSNLITKELVAAGEWDTISKNTAEVLQWIVEVRK
jgi:2-dehydro-3-deoxyphosphogluconate aldolase/(4S)-4-hydroxy-2-oxoglutarate aldolase